MLPLSTFFLLISSTQVPGLERFESRIAKDDAVSQRASVFSGHVEPRDSYSDTSAPPSSRHLSKEKPLLGGAYAPVDEPLGSPTPRILARRRKSPIWICVLTWIQTVIQFMFIVLGISRAAIISSLRDDAIAEYCKHGNWGFIEYAQKENLCCNKKLDSFFSRVNYVNLSYWLKLLGFILNFVFNLIKSVRHVIVARGSRRVHYILNSLFNVSVFIAQAYAMTDYLFMMYSGRNEVLTSSCWYTHEPTIFREQINNTIVNDILDLFLVVGFFSDWYLAFPILARKRILYG